MYDPIANVRTLSPRVKLAARLYATGLVPTKREAGLAVGLHPLYFPMLTQRNPVVRSYMEEVMSQVEDQTVDVSLLLDRLGRAAVGKLATLMQNASSEGIQLKAAQDLADRSPRTQKVQRIDANVGSFTLAGADVEALTRAMRESAEQRAKYNQVAEEGLVELQDLQALPPAPEAA
jgi:hypothetical protein